jgi:hypothetical protein
VSVVVELMIVLLVVVPAFPALLLAILIHRRVWRSDSPSLRERTLLAFRDWLVASIAATLALRSLGMIELVPRSATLPLLAIAMLLVSLPSAYWLWLYFRGAFR